MIKITKPEKSIITGKPIENDFFRDDCFITFRVGEITKVTTDTDVPGNEVVMDFFDDNGQVFTVSQRAYVPLYMATCLINVDSNNVVSEELQEENNDTQDRLRVVCSDPRVVWLALVHTWLTTAIKENIGDQPDEVFSQILTDLIPSYDEAVKNLEKNKYPPFASCYSDIEYASEKYRGEEARENHLDYQAYLEKYGDWLIEPPKVDWDKYRN